ncbi:MAG TPA: hypothetical protein VMT22_10945, partial [Terriglobales bacterium]|nr:hypothetical protein [Terriglobales bacterium]
KRHDFKCFKTSCGMARLWVNLQSSSSSGRSGQQSLQPLSFLAQNLITEAFNHIENFYAR